MSATTLGTAPWIFLRGTSKNWVLMPCEDFTLRVCCSKIVSTNALWTRFWKVRARMYALEDPLDCRPWEPTKGGELAGANRGHTQQAKRQNGAALRSGRRGPSRRASRRGRPPTIPMGHCNVHLDARRIIRIEVRRPTQHAAPGVIGAARVEGSTHHFRHAGVNGCGSKGSRGLLA